MEKFQSKSVGENLRHFLISEIMFVRGSGLKRRAEGKREKEGDFLTNFPDNDTLKSVIRNGQCRTNAVHYYI